MKITKKNLTEYLLTLMLVNAGYHFTFDEMMEINITNFAKDNSFAWHLHYTQTIEQSKKWFVDATALTQKTLNITEQHAAKLVAELDLYCGLTLKG
jgi:hypothetical protein